MAAFGAASDPRLWLPPTTESAGLGINCEGPHLEAVAVDLVRGLLGLPRAVTELTDIDAGSRAPAAVPPGIYAPAGPPLFNYGTWIGRGGFLVVQVDQGKPAVRTPWGPLGKPRRLHRLDSDDPALAALATNGAMLTDPGFTTVQAVTDAAGRDELIIDGRARYVRTPLRGLPSWGRPYHHPAST